MREGLAEPSGRAQPRAEEEIDQRLAWRNAEQEMRFLLLVRAYELSGGDSQTEVHARCLAEDLDLPLENVFAMVERLSREDYLAYLGAGPRVSVTPVGIDYIESARQRRRTVRV